MQRCKRSKDWHLLTYFIRVILFRETLEVPDGGIVCLDWFDNEASVHTDPLTRPTVLILPGLTGENCSTSYNLFVEDIKI